MIQLDVNGKGFAAYFPYDASVIASLKRCLGFNWNPKARRWESEGPEVLLDLERFHIPFQHRSIASVNLAAEFNANLLSIMETRSQEEAALQQDGSTPYLYQMYGSESLAFQKRGILADDPGLGKSRQALLAARKLGAASILIIAPKSLIWNWPDEIDKWCPDWNWYVYDGDFSKRKKAWDQFQSSQPVKILICNYEKLRLSDWPRAYHWDVVIADEVTKVKNKATGIHKALKKVKSDALFALSGTPLEMRLEELYGIMSLVRPSVFGNFSRFREQHLITDYFGGVIGSKNHEMLKERLAPWMIRRTKDEVAKELPPKIYNTLWVELTPTEREEYEQIQRDFEDWLIENERELTELNVMTQMLRLQQFTSSPDLILSTGGCRKAEGSPWRGSKFEQLVELLDEWPGKAMIFTKFEQMALRIVDWLGLNPQAIISGPVDAKDRVDRVRMFNDGILGPALVATEAGAYGLNIQTADLVVHYDLLWNPAKMEQREDRLHRIGQTNVVNVVKLVAKGTLDEGILNVLAKRRELFRDIIDGAEEVLLQRFSASQLKAMARGTFN